MLLLALFAIAFAHRGGRGRGRPEPEEDACSVLTDAEKQALFDAQLSGFDATSDGLATTYCYFKPRGRGNDWPHMPVVEEPEEETPEESETAIALSTGRRNLGWWRKNRAAVNFTQGVSPAIQVAEREDGDWMHTCLVGTELQLTVDSVSKSWDEGAVRRLLRRGRGRGNSPFAGMEVTLTMGQSSTTGYTELTEMTITCRAHARDVEGTCQIMKLDCEHGSYSITTGEETEDYHFGLMCSDDAERYVDWAFETADDCPSTVSL